MGEQTLQPQRTLKVLVSVRCLECGGVYAKPSAGGTAAMNPGCPDCGYLGWSPFTPEAAWLPLRFGAGRRQRRHA